MPAKVARKAEVPVPSGPSVAYGSRIISYLSVLGTMGDTRNPDEKHNAGKLLGEAFLWKTVMNYAKRKYEKAIDKCAGEFVDRTYEEGEYELVQSPKFVYTIKVSKPVRRFDPDTLAASLRKKYKIPEPITKELIEAAKVPTNSTITPIIEERA